VSYSIIGNCVLAISVVTLVVTLSRLDVILQAPLNWFQGFIWLL